MKLVGYELFKIFSKRFILIGLPLLLLANGFLYYQKEMKANDYLIKNIKDYYKLESSYKSMPPGEALDKAGRIKNELNDYMILRESALDLEDPGYRDMLQAQLEDIRKNKPQTVKNFMNSPYKDDAGLLRKDAFFTDLIDMQLQTLNKYKDYIDGLQKRADDMLSVSIFRKEGTFSYRNIIKTPADFEHLKGIPLQIGLDNGIVSATRFPITDIAVFLGIFLLCIYLFLHERESGLIRLIRTNKKGRVGVIAAKLVTLVLATAAIAVAFYGTIIITADRLYGLGDMSRYIQSMADFRKSNMLLTVGQYLWLFLISKVIACVLLALILSAFFILINNAGKIYLSIAGLLGFSYISYVFIHPLSYLNLFKYINIFAFLNTFSLLGEYKNINFFGYPVNNLWLSAICTAALFVILPAIAVITYVKYYSYRSQVMPSGLWSTIKTKISVPGRTVRLPVHELYKALFTEKIYIVFFIALIIGVNNINFKEVRFNEDDAIYNSYLKAVSGELNEGKIKFIEDEKTRFDQLPYEYEKIQKAYSNGEITLLEYNREASELDLFALKRKAFDRVYEQYNYLTEIKITKGLNVGFVNEISSDYLFNDRSRDIINGLIYTILLILCACVIFPADYRNGIISILRCTRNGRFKLFACKHAVGYIAAFALMIIIYAPQYINLIKDYNVENWDVPVRSIMLFKDVDINISIIEFIIMETILQFLGSLIVTHCVLFLSLIVKRHSLSVLISSAVFVCPILIQFTGLDFIQRYSFNNIHLLFLNFAGSSPIGNTVVYYLVLTAIFVFVNILCWNKYNNNSMVLGVKKHDSFNQQRQQEL